MTTLTITLPDSLGRRLVEHLDEYKRADAKASAALAIEDWNAFNTAMSDRNLNADGVVLLLKDDLKTLIEKEEARP